MNLYNRYLAYKDKLLHHIARIFGSTDDMGLSNPENKPKLLEYPYDEVKRRKEHQASPIINEMLDTQGAVIQGHDPYIEGLTQKLKSRE